MDHLTNEEKQKIEDMEAAIDALAKVQKYRASIFGHKIAEGCADLIEILSDEIEDLKE